MTQSQLIDVIESAVVVPPRAFCAKPGSSCLASFMTGSYVRGTVNIAAPTMNIYFIANKSDAPVVRLDLAEEFAGIAGELGAYGCDVALDCHPYTVSYAFQRRAGNRTLTITSKVLEASDEAVRFRLPPTIGSSWLTHYRMIHGSAQLLVELALKPKTDLDWFHAIHEALSRYRNLLDHLPWALPWRDSPRLLFEESTRYAEETLKDGFTVVLNQAELDDGRHFQLFHGTGAASAEFLEQRYGSDGAWMADSVSALKKICSSGGEIARPAAEHAWQTALRVWDIVWSKFKYRVATEQPDHAQWLCRPNAFV